MADTKTPGRPLLTLAIHKINEQKRPGLTRRRREDRYPPLAPPKRGIAETLRNLSEIDETDCRRLSLRGKFSAPTGRHDCRKMSAKKLSFSKKLSFFAPDQAIHEKTHG